MSKVKLIQQVFEIRYERGYRYLDRAGEVMLILEELLYDQTGKLWLQDEVNPTAARLKCPELDLRVTFNSAQLIVDQQPAREDFSLIDLSEMIYSVLVGRFDLRTVVRMGCRRWFVAPADSVEEGEAMSVRIAAPAMLPDLNTNEFKPKAFEQSCTFESTDGTGVRVGLKPWERPEAPEQIDERLRAPARLLPTGQKAALLDQLRRRKIRDTEPVAGLLIDVDIFSVRPAKPNLKSFLDKALGETLRLAESCAARR